MSTRYALPALAIAALLLASSAVPASPRTGLAPARVQDEDDEHAFALELGRRSFEGNCLMCHSAEMVESQRLTPEQWAAEVEKMIGWGAPVPDEEKGLLVSFLVARYPAELEPAEVPRLTLDEARAPTRPEPAPDALPAGDPERGAALHVEHCATCHGTDGKGGDLGTNLIARPVLHRPADYAAILRDGRHRMPGFRYVLSPQQVADTLAWLRSRSG